MKTPPPSTHHDIAMDRLLLRMPSSATLSSATGTYQAPFSDGIDLSNWDPGEEAHSLIPASSSTVHQAVDTGKPLGPALGIPKRKHILGKGDILALVLSILSCALAIASVADHRVAWNLRLQGQLIVAGFLLSVMNLCLATVTPFLCILLEARLGPSTLQNYDAILRGQILGTRLSIAWRLVLLCLLLLPIGLSVAYKTFQTGGSSSLVVNATLFTSHDPDYGIFNLPNLAADAMAMFYNATLPFRSAADGGTWNGTEPAGPSQFPQPYGANTIVLSNFSAAILDLPREKRLFALQQSLDISESVVLNATVRGSVATKYLYVAASQDPEFAAACEDKVNMVQSLNGGNSGYSTRILAPSGLGNNSRIWLGWTPDAADNLCEGFLQYAQRYDIKRRSCNASWIITRATIRLSEASCDDNDLPELEQYVFTVNTFYLGRLWTEVLNQAIYQFGGPRNESVWKEPSLAVTASAMVRSPLVAINGGSQMLNGPA